MAVTTADKYREARRELAYRRNVFKKQVADRRMTQFAADRRIAIMTAIAADYERLLQEEQSKPNKRNGCTSDKKRSV